MYASILFCKGQELLELACEFAIVLLIIDDWSFQFDGPVGVVEELLPASVAVVAEVDVDEGIVPV